MLRWATSVVGAFLLVVAAAPASPGRASGQALRLGGTPLQLLAGRGSLWVLTCDRGCTGEARHSIGRIIRIDPRTARVVGSAKIPRPGTIAIGAGGLYATDFEHNTIRRLDLHTLQVAGALKLKLPFRFSARDNAFLPESVAVGRDSVWVVSDRGAIVRADPRLHRTVATLRMPPNAFGDPVGGMAVDARGVWSAESLAGVYRVDQQTNRVSAKIRVPLTTGKFDAVQVFPLAGQVLALGVETSGGTLTQRNVLARIDANHKRVEGTTSLPSGPLVATTGAGSLWTARLGGSTVERIDPRTGRVVARIRARVGNALAVAGDHLWTASPGRPGSPAEMSFCLALSALPRDRCGCDR
jgi:streptogramin lyase